MRDILGDIEQDLLLSEQEGGASASHRQNLPKRFYKDVSVEPVDDGDLFEVRLDGRPARTPGRAHIRLPTIASAQLVADEFARQVQVIDPSTMPVLRIANTAIDGVLRDPEPVAEDLLKFGGSDLLFYRADTPDRLVDRQSAVWDPIIAWAERAMGARFAVTTGVIFVDQPEEAATGLRRYVDPRQTDPFLLTCLHLMTSLTGSVLIALAVEAKAISPDEAWVAAHVDEDWQIEQWGQDSEAIARRNARRRDFEAAVKLIEALKT